MMRGFKGNKNVWNFVGAGRQNYAALPHSLGQLHSASCGLCHSWAEGLKLTYKVSKQLASAVGVQWSRTRSVTMPAWRGGATQLCTEQVRQVVCKKLVHMYLGTS